VPAVHVLPQPDVLIPGQAQVGEGPVLDPRTGRLCWVDITEGALYQHDLDSGEQDIATVGCMLGAIAPRRSRPGFAAAVSDGFGFITDGRLDVTDAALPEPHRRMNDAKCDSAGRLWAGSTHMELTPGGGGLHRWDGTGPSRLVADGFILPNGIGWSPDDRVMYLADSIEHTLLRAAFQPSEGEVGPFDVLAHVEAGLPDGLAVDGDGCVWLAVWGGWQVVRLDPGGNVIARAPVPVAQPSSCALTADGALYITSARAGLTPAELAGQPHAGSVFALAAGSAGVPVSPFAA
jgi:sugar lactone lactonase YvrE